MFADLAVDVRQAARRLAASPLFTAFAVLSLAAGVGITTAVYSVVHSLMFQDEGIPSPERVVLVMTPDGGRFVRGSMSRRDLDDLRHAQQSFASLGASALIYPAVASTATTELVIGEAVNGAYFSTLGVRAAIGRTIQEADDRAGAALVVLSHGLWRRRFGSDRRIVGQMIRLSGTPFEIIGVAEASFDGPRGPWRSTQVWVPLGTESQFRSSSPPVRRGSELEGRRLLVFGRLQPGRTVQAASAELAGLAARLDSARPQASATHPSGVEARGWTGTSLADPRPDRDMRWRFGVLVVGLVALVLVVACTNLANLMLARGTVRHQEFAIRRALGASRGRLIREQTAESAILACAGGIGAYVVVQALRAAMAIDLPLGGSWIVSIQPELNVRALTVAAVSVVLSLLVFGLEPALALTRSSHLNAELAGGTGGVPKAGRQRALLRWQVAISAGFFIIATMCVKYSVAEAMHESGIDLHRLALVTTNFHVQQWDESRVRRTLEQVEAAARQDPAIEAVATSTGLPFGRPGTPSVQLSTAGRPGGREANHPGALAIAATPPIFRTLGIPLVRGRIFDTRDRAGGLPVIVLSEGIARRLFGTSDVVGRELVMRQGASRAAETAKTVTIVGIVRDTDKGRLFGTRGDVVYLPFEQHYERMLTITARARGDASAAVRALQDAVRRVDPDLAIEAAGTGRAILGGPIVFLRAAGILAVSLGALTLLLAMVGLFGVQSHIVGHRTREIGVRMSLGATPRQIRGMILKDGYRPVFEGMAIGMAIGFAGRAIVRAYVALTIPIVDPWVLVIIPLPLLLAAFWACYLPAQRAARVDPNVALRHL